MNNRLRVFLSLILLVFFIGPFFGQENKVDAEINPNRLEGFTKAHSKKRSSAPMVIGPDLHNQMGDNAGYLIINSNYNNPAFQVYNSFPADDFVIPEGETWQVEYVRNLIYSQGSTDSINSVNVIVYSDNDGIPGNEVEVFSELEDIYFDNEALGYGFISEITITLPSIMTLPAGKYWLCVQANNNVTAINAYGDPAYWSGIMPQSSETPIYSDAHFKHPGGGYYPFYEWTSATDYSPVFGGEPGIPYMPNYNFGLYAPAVANDLAVTSIYSPETGGSLTDNETVIALVQNHGLSDVSNFEIRFRVNGGNWVTEEGGAISSGDELTYSFHEGADLSVPGNHEIEVEVILTGDEYQANNSLSTELINYGAILPAIADGKVEYRVCEGTFTDHGGLDDPDVTYSNDTVIFIAPDSRSRMRIEFYDTEMSGAYAFRFYDGIEVTDPEIGDWEALNGDEGIFTQEVHGLVVEGVNSKGAITVLPPGFDTEQSSVNNFMAKVSCVTNQDTDFKVMKLESSKDFSWEKESIELTATIKSRGLETSGQLVTFFANDTEIETVSTTTLAFGESTQVTVQWTPETAGIYTLKAQVPDDEGAFADEKYFELEKEIFEQGRLIEGFEEEQFPPVLWESKSIGFSDRGFIWYNNRDSYQGKWSVGIDGDTLVTPRLNIQAGDKLQFIYDAGFFGGTCDILYAENPEGPWTVHHTVDYGWPWSTDYTVDLSAIAGVKYLAFNGSGCTIDYVRGPKLHFYENDLMLASFDGPEDPQANQEIIYAATVKNYGSADLNPADYTIKLWSEQDGVTTELVSVPGVAITLSNAHVFELPVTFDMPQEAYIYASIVFAADEDLSNNTTMGKNIVVIEEGVDYVYLGDVETEASTFTALAGYYANYTEVVYKASDIKTKGEISGLSIYYSGSKEQEYKLKLFIGETENENVEEGFISTKYMDEVYAGAIEAKVTNGQYVQEYIQFDQPYLYSGNKNIVIGFYHPYTHGANFGGSLYVKTTATDYQATRWRGLQQYEVNTDISNPDELNTLGGNNYMDAPNVTLYINAVGMDASLAGTVIDENSENYEGALIELEGFANSTLSDENGQYAFPVLPVGETEVRISAYGYYNDSTLATFTSDNETIVDFNLQKLPPVQIAGNVIGNDLQQALSNVSVTVEGYGLEMTGMSDENGDFAVANLYADKAYQVTFEHPRYATFIDTVFVSIEGIDIGTVALDELETPAFNLFAEINENQNVDLSWQAPYTGDDAIIDPTLGVQFGSYWYNEPDEDVQLGNLFRVEEPGTLTAIQFSNYAWEGAASAELYLRFYNKEREEIMEPVPFMMPDSTVDWAVVEVPHFSYTEDFYVMIHWDKVHEQTGAIMSHQHNDNVAYLIDENGDWMLLTDVVGSVYAGAFSIKAEVLEEGAKAGTKELVSYDIWRSKLSDITNQDNWVKLNEEPIAGSDTEVTYSDETFVDAADDFYTYILETQYTLGNSPYLFSNSIEKGLFSPVTINVIANNEQDITGAKVVFENQNGADVNRYVDYVADGKVEFPSVRKGDYDLTISKGAAYEVYESEDIVVDATLELNTKLLEVIFNPTMLRVETNEDTREALFSWGVGTNDYLIEDDYSFEQSLSIGADGDAELGNYFEVDAAGQIYNVEIYGTEDNSNNPANEMGAVSIGIYNANRELIGESDPFSIQPDSVFDVAVDFVQFDGPFYIMVRWSSSETLNTHGLGVDTDSDPGVAFWNDAEYGFVQLAEWGYYGNFGIRTNVLINGKQSSVEASTLSPSNAEMPEIIKSTKIAKTAVPASRSVLSYNIFLNDEDTPVAEGVTEQNFTFTSEHFNVYPEETAFSAGVQAVFFTGTSLKVWEDFTIRVDIMDVINAKLNVYPNPASETLVIENATNASIYIYNTLGELVNTIESNSVLQTIDVSNLETGTYILQFDFEEGSIYRNLVITR